MQTILIYWQEHSAFFTAFAAYAAVSLGGCTTINTAAPLPAKANHAPRVLNARVTAPDRAQVEAASIFYAKAFGMHELGTLLS